jgi:4a-hydroxytetrahydrobiopterin dehydratase
MTQNLKGKVCTPCQGGIPPLSQDEARKFLGDVPGWALIEDAAKLEKEFTFKNFADTLDFVTRVGELAESEGHHPVITFGWGFCTIQTQTKKIKGLHENDFILAAKINGLA